MLGLKMTLNGYFLIQVQGYLRFLLKIILIFGQGHLYNFSLPFFFVGNSQNSQVSWVYFYVTTIFSFDFPVLFLLRKQAKLHAPV